jgi:hypothetical protein
MRQHQTGWTCPRDADLGPHGLLLSSGAVLRQVAADDPAEQFPLDGIAVRFRVDPRGT